MKNCRQTTFHTTTPKGCQSEREKSHRRENATEIPYLHKLNMTVVGLNCLNLLKDD